MNKFKFSNWLGTSPSPTAAEVEQKKQNRRSFTPFITRSAAKPRDDVPNGAPIAKPAPVASEKPTYTPSRLTELAKKIASETEKVERYMQENNLPMPSLDPNGPSDFPKLPEDIQKSRMEIIFATRELEALAHGPREDVRWKTWSVSREVWKMVKVVS